MIVSLAKCQPLKQAIRGLAGGARAPTFSESPVSGHGEWWDVGGGREERRVRHGPNGEVGWERGKSITVQMFPFLPPDSSFVLCTLLLFSQLLVQISSGISS